MTFNCTHYKQGTKFLSLAIQESQVFRDKQEVHTAKSWKPHLHFSSLENKGERAPYAHRSRRNYHICSFQVLFGKEDRFPGSPCHMTTRDSWLGRVPQTLWQRRPLRLVSQQMHRESNTPFWNVHFRNRTSVSDILQAKQICNMFK